VVLATLGVVFAAIYLLNMMRLTLRGPITRAENANLPDLSLREVLALAPLCVFMLWIGVAPAGFLRASQDHLDGLVRNVRGRLREVPVEVATLRSRPAPAPADQVAGGGARPSPASAGAASGGGSR
jgi:NADH:ubiquinone oxidoreductase subunit 4 (subunit M)